MNVPTVVHGRPRLRSRVDLASIVLLRSAMADRRPERAARELLATADGDRRILALVRARLSRASWERPTRITERASLILDHALSATPPTRRPAGAFVPRQGGRNA